MARRKAIVRRVYPKVRRYVSKRKGLISKNMIWAAGAGAAGGFIPKFLGQWTLPAVFGAGGFFLKKPILMELAAYEGGKAAAQTFLGGAGNTNNNGGWV
jgi:hypothetical protein